MANTVDKVISIAEREVGYLEKASNSQLDSKTANAGKKNFTKYARDIDKIESFYNGKKQGYAWCDVFVDWCFIKAYGVEEAKKLLCQPDRSCGAGCEFSMQYYKNKGQWYTTPAIGDQIIFRNGAHTGLVYDFDATYVYTIEGNTSSAAGVVENGGAVRKKKYRLTSTSIDGYGRPNYDIRTYLMKGDKGEEVGVMQTMLIECGYSCGKSGADKSFGAATEKALKKFQDDYSLVVDGKYGVKSKAKLEEAYKIKTTKKTEVTYITHRIDGNKWGNEIVGYNEVDSMGYSGSFGKRIDKVAIKLSEGKITYSAHRLGGTWGGDITGYSTTNTMKYAGSTNKPIDAITMKATGINGKLKYRVHRKTDNKWGNWITGFSKTDTNQYAGSMGKEIDAIQIGIE